MTKQTSSSSTPETITDDNGMVSTNGGQDWFHQEGDEATEEGKRQTLVKVDESTVDVTSLSFDELMATLGAEVVSINELDPREQFDKADLINIPFVITGVHVNPNGEYGAFVVCELKTATNRTGWFSDGSSGIARQLIELHERNTGAKAIFVPKGLRSSTYQTTDNNGNEITATTYYLSNAAK